MSWQVEMSKFRMPKALKLELWLIGVTLVALELCLLIAYVQITSPT